MNKAIKRKIARQERLVKRDNRIKKLFFNMRNNKKDGVRIYRDEYIFHILANRFALSQETIRKIIYESYTYKDYKGKA